MCPVIGMVWSDLVLVWSRPPRLVVHLYYIHSSALRLRNNPLHLDLKVD
ncbi:hypothetical protein HZ326_30732, partial [Fusarium oxysporum f. sp. albedinis]